MKEVDLEKEFDDYTKDIMACDVQFAPFTHLYNCAKHFFELGLKAQGDSHKYETQSGNIVETTWERK